MENIIALGKGACSLSEHFSNYPQYTVYRIDSEFRSGDRFYQVEKSDSHEEYERNFSGVGTLFDGLSGPVLFVVSGGGKISGCSLALLQEISTYTDKVSVLYIHPEVDFISKEALEAHNLTFGVLQEYARSGALKEIWLVSPSAVEQIIGDIPVIGYFKVIDEYVVSAIHMINVLSHNVSEFDTFRKPDEAARICTLGVADIENSEEKLFFPLTMPREVRYYYAINRERLETDGAFLRDLKKSMVEKLDGKTRISYGIYSTDYADSYAYVVQRSSLIQGVKR